MTGSENTETVNGLSPIMEPIHRVIARCPTIALAYLFGSHVHGDVGPMSDLDVAVLLDSAEGKSAVIENLRSSIALALNQERVDVLFLNRAPVELAYAIIVDGEVIYKRNEYTRVEYEAKIMGLYCDYLPVLRAQRKDLLSGDDHETRVQRNREAFGRTERTLGALRGFEV